jgi:hypothetical protein
MLRVRAAHAFNLYRPLALNTLASFKSVLFKLAQQHNHYKHKAHHEQKFIGDEGPDR